MIKNKKIEESSGNVFRDLGFENPEELQAKSSLIHQLSSIIKTRKLSQVQAAKILGIDQPKVSRLLRGNLDGFSTDRIFRFLNALGQDIEILIKPKKRKNKAAEVRVLAA